MPEFCPPQDYRAASANSGERLQFFSSNGRDWQKECFSGRMEGTADRWQQVSADIWTNRGDLPPVLADFVTREQQAIERADKLDPKQILTNVHAGFDRKMQSDLQIAASLARNESPSSGLKDTQNKQDWENWNNYKDFLSPAGKRASMGFALISSGIDRHIKEGEKMLVEAVRLRPELQFNEDFQKRVVQSYKDMARTRIDMGLPMYRGSPQLEPINSGRQPILGTDPARPLLADARKQGQEHGIKSATEKYDKAITESDNKDFATIKDIRLATFVQRLLLDRTIIESEERGIPSGYMRNQRKIASDREVMVYDRYMSPAKVRSEAALDMIASGDPQMFERGKKLLGDALKLRPELEFSEKFNRDKQSAFLQHFRNAQKTDGSKVPSPPNKPQGNSDGKTYSMPFVNRPDGFRLPPLLVPPKRAEVLVKKPGQTDPGSTVAGADKGKGSDSPPTKQINTDIKTNPPKLAGTDSTVRYQELPEGNPFDDKDKGYSQKEIEDLAAKGILALLLAGGTYKLIKKGNEYFFEKQKTAEGEQTQRPEARAVTDKPAETKPNAETERERAARVEAEAEAKAAADTIARLEAEAKTNAETRAKLEAELKASEETRTKLEADAKRNEEARAKLETDAKTNEEARAKLETDAKADKAEITRLHQELDANRQAREQESAKVAEERRTSSETIDKLKGDITKAETDRQAEIAKHAAEIERLNTARQADIERMRADGQAEIERLTSANKAEIERLTGSNKAEFDRLTGEKDAEIQRQKTATERVEAALVEANKARETERQAAETQRQQLETSLEQSEKTRTTERQAADAQRQQLQTALEQSETARTTEGEQHKAKIEQTAEQLRSSQGENAELKKQNGGLQTELDTARSTNTSLQSQVDEAKRKSATLEQNLTDAQTGRETAEQRNATLQEELTGTKSQRDTAEQRNLTLQKEVTDATAQRDAANQQNSTLQKSLTAVQSERDAANERNGTLQTTLTETEAKRAASDSKIVELTTALQNSEQTRAGDNEKATTEQARLQKLLETSEAGKTASDKKVETLEGELETARAERDRITVLAKGDRAQLEANIRSLTEQLQKATEDKSTIEKTAGEASEAQQRQIAELQRKLADATSKLTGKEQTVADNERKLAERDQTIAAKDQTIAAKDQKLSETEQKLAERDQSLAENERTIADKDQALAENQRKLADANAKMAADAKEHATGKQALEQQVTDLTTRVDQLTEQQRAEQQTLATERATTTQQVVELQEKLGKATTDGLQKDDALAKLKAEHERQLAELTKRAEQAEQAKLAAEQGRQSAEQAKLAAEQAKTTAEQAKVTAEQGRSAAEEARTIAERQAETEKARAQNAESERDTARSELTAERSRVALADTKPAVSPTDVKPDVKPADQQPEVKPGEVKPAEAKPADTKVVEAEQTGAKVPQTTEQPTAPRRRIRGGAVQLDTTVVAQNEGNGTFSREVTQGSGIDGTPESKGEKISADQIQLVKEEIQRLKETKVATDESKARNLERVLSILERTDSPRVQEAAHKYIASRILDGESRHAEAGGGARAAIGRGVSAGIVASAFLSYYTMREEMLRKGGEVEESASVGSSKK